MLLNADLGEEVIGEEFLIPFIHVASISCGAHAGEASSIRNTIRLCAQQGVIIGAHPSFVDRVHFGRVDPALSHAAIQELVVQQLEQFRQWATEEGASVSFVKPHGALYNLSARDPEVAACIGEALKSVDATWTLMGLAGSCSVKEAHSIGLSTWSEAFADRRYLADGSLCPRTDPRALIIHPVDATEQVRLLTEEKKVLSLEGTWVPTDAQVVCVHGDSPTALDVCRAIRAYIDKQQVHDKQ